MYRDLKSDYHKITVKTSHLSVLLESTEQNELENVYKIFALSL